MTDQTVSVGRAATPPPPNVGSSTLGRILGLDTDPRFAGHLHVLGLVAPDLFDSLTRTVGPVMPVVPGLAEEAVGSMPVRCVVIDEDALQRGVWSGVLEKHAPELRVELTRFLDATIAAGHPVYWLRRQSTANRTQNLDTGDADWSPEDPGLPEVPCPQAVLIAPGSPMADGVVEGARPSKLIAVLQSVLQGSPNQD